MIAGRYNYDHAGVCGFEIKNRGFTGFAKGGEKGLWISAGGPADTRLVIAESAIDALSYAALHPDELARYASTGGSLNPSQPELIRGAIRKMPAGAQIIAATDADGSGRRLAELIRAMVDEAREAGRSDLTFAARPPAEEGADWNDMVRRQAPAEPPPFPVV
jgi:hypothetical protein